MPDYHATLTARNIVFCEVTKNASPELLEILNQAHEFFSTKLADSTQEIYGRDWKSFTRWCDKLGLPKLPSNAEVVACYFTALAMKGFRIATIRRHSAAIAAAHRGSGHSSPTSHPAIKELLHGMTRRIGTPPKPVDALLSEDIKKMVGVIPDTLQGARDKALILIGFAGAFRRSEIVGLNVEHLGYRDDGLAILLPKSKTDQKGEGRWVGIPYGKNPETCPVAALRRWIELAGIAEGPVFKGLNKHHKIISNRLSSRSVSDIIKRVAKAAGLDPTNLSGHSLRSGHCTQAARCGVAEHVIRMQTGHVSPDSLKKYVRMGRLFEENSADALGL